MAIGDACPFLAFYKINVTPVINIVFVNCLKVAFWILIVKRNLLMANQEQKHFK